MLKEYDSFARTITKLRAELRDPATRREHLNFLGSGSNAMVFSVTEGNKPYAVRVPHGKGISPGAIDSHLAGAVLGKGIPHLEQIVAASYKDGVTVAELMPGREVGHLTVDEIKGVTDEQLGELVDTLAAVSEHGIEIDPKPSNIFYDPKEGYGIVDYHSSKVAGKGSVDQDLGTIVGWMATGIDNAGFYGKPYGSEKTTEDYAHDLEFKKANLGVLERYRSVVEAKLSGDEQQTALADIDNHIASGKEAVDNYSNPEWVAERIAQDREWKQKQAELAKKPATDGWITLDTV